MSFVEPLVSGPTTWSLATTLHSEIADVYYAARDRAASQIIVS